MRRRLQQWRKHRGLGRGRLVLRQWQRDWGRLSPELGVSGRDIRTRSLPLLPATQHGWVLLLRFSQRSHASWRFSLQYSAAGLPIVPRASAPTSDEPCVPCTLCLQAPARAPSLSSLVWFDTLLPELLWSASPRHTATAAAATPPCGPPPQV